MKMDNLRDQVHKWRGERQQKMVQRLTKNKNEIRPNVSTAILGVKTFSSSIEASSQINNEKKLPRKAPTEVRPTKSSTQRQLLANPLLEPKNVEFLENLQRRQTLFLEKSETNEVNLPKIITKEARKEQMLNMMTKYDLNGRRLILHASIDDLSKSYMNKSVCIGSQSGAVPKTLKSKTNTNKKKNNLSSSFSHLTKKNCKTLSDVKSSDNTKIKYQSAINSLQKGKRSQSCSNVRTNIVGVKRSHLYNKELADFEQKHCKSDIEESVLQDSNTFTNQKRETIILCKGKLPTSSLVQDERRITFLKTTINKSVSKTESRQLSQPERKKTLIKRRSLSQEHLQRKKIITNLRRSSSTEELKYIRKQVKFVSPVVEETSSMLADISLSGHSQRKRPNVSTPHNVLSTPHSIEQRKKLLKWLSDKGKPLNSYRHLQCFNIAGKHVLRQSRKQIDQTKIKDSLNKNINEIDSHADEKEEANNFDEENKENVCSTPLEYKGVELEESELVNITREALIDLRSLVKAGYDHDECDAWMQALRNRFPKIYEFVEYWECLASLDEAKGDYNMAVDSYQRAIVRGAEVDNISDQLDGLLSKMSHLNLETPHKGRKTTSPRNKVDIKNIFKSKVIQFALQQKAVKKLSTDLGDNTRILYIATPVRRSTRRNIHDPKCVRTLDDIEPEKRCLTEFLPNPAFH